ncbi:DUF2179 domain-containing protein [Lacunimicrobium album]
MSFLLTLSPLQLGILIFFLRICDVSIGTLRMIAVVNGRIPLSVCLGFIEVFLWVFGVSQILPRIAEHPLIIVAYAGGFATGNAVGIAIEKRMALGMVVIRILTTNYGKDMHHALANVGAEQITMFSGHNDTGVVTEVYMIAPRRKVNEITRAAQQIDANLFYTIEPLRQWSTRSSDRLPITTNWRNIFRYKYK